MNFDHFANGIYFLRGFFKSLHCAVPNKIIFVFDNAKQSAIAERTLTEAVRKEDFIPCSFNDTDRVRSVVGIIIEFQPEAESWRSTHEVKVAAAKESLRNSSDPGATKPVEDNNSPEEPTALTLSHQLEAFTSRLKELKQGTLTSG